jgi:hypothetical protein
MGHHGDEGFDVCPGDFAEAVVSKYRLQVVPDDPFVETGGARLPIDDMYE